MCEAGLLCARSHASAHSPAALLRCAVLASVCEAGPMADKIGAPKPVLTVRSVAARSYARALARSCDEASGA
jgi:hypothetical protein